MIEFDAVSFTYQQAKAKRSKRSRQTAGDVPRADWGNAPDASWALRDITFSIADGEFLGIAGHTGSGKSTLIQLANGLLKPTIGTVRIDGVNIADKRAAAQARRSVGVVFQYPEHQLFAATVRDDVAFGPRNFGLSEEEVDERVREALELVKVDYDAVADVSPFSLSGGQQRRVALAGVLACRPQTLILDEPMAGLDPAGRRRLATLVRSLHRDRGLTCALVSHDMDLLGDLCGRVLVLDRGCVFALGSCAEVFSDEERLHSVGLGVPRTVSVASRLAAAGIALPAYEGVPTQEQLANDIARALGVSQTASQAPALGGAGGTEQGADGEVGGYLG